MKKILISILILFTIEIYSQVAATNPIILPQGYSLNLLNSKGTSGINNSVSNINFINPAALDEFYKITAGISYEYQTNIKEAWFAGIGYKRYSNITPQSFGLIIPIKELKIGISAGQTYKSNMDLGEIPTTTTEQPDGAGETFNADFKTNIYSYSFLLSYS